MAIGFLREAKCDLCKDLIDDGFEVHEVDSDVWIIVCAPCSLVTEIGEGK